MNSRPDSPSTCHGGLLTPADRHPHASAPAHPVLRAWRCAALALALPLAVVAAEKVTESDHATLRQLQYAEALGKARLMFARGDATKQAQAKAVLTQALQESGWNRERYDAVEEAVGDVMGNLRLNKSGDMSDADLKSALEDSDPTTVATVRAHYEELNKTNDSQRAEKQVRDEIQEEAAGVPPTRAQLEGTWVYDPDASIDAMLGGMATAEDKAKLKATIAAKVGSPEYTFGPGDSVVSRSRDSAGNAVVFKGVYRLDGRKIFFKNEGSKREESLSAGLRNGKLQLGMGGLGYSVFSRK